jgi:hypothetical protein
MHSSQQQGEQVLPGGKGQATAGANALRALLGTAPKAAGATDRVLCEAEC